MVVTNAGPLMALAKVGKLDLLWRLHGQVVLPAAVQEEVVTQGLARRAPDAPIIRAAIQRGHLAVREVRDAELPADISGLSLQAGEKQTLYLALREQASLVLLDDQSARDAAEGRGLRVKGTLGVLRDACRDGLLTLPEVQQAIGVVIARSDIWIAESLCLRVLSELESASADQA